MLPCLNFICQKMPLDPPIKPRRKKLEVPIHDEDNFETPQRISRKQLYRENMRIFREKEEISAKFSELNDISVRKITKLREKIHNLQKINEEISDERDLVKKQCQELVDKYTTLQNELELSKNCRDCQEFRDLIEKISSDNKLLRISKSEVEEDLNMLKTVVFRLNLQMERYQDKLRKKSDDKAPLMPSIEDISVNNNNIVIIENHQDHSHTPISWGRVNIHTLGPLLDAYQDTIAEKEEIIGNYQTELTNFTGKLKEIIAENNLLHEQLTEDEGCSVKLKIEVGNLKEELKASKEQNDVLIKKCALKQDKIEEILKCYEAKVEQLKRDYSVAHEQYYKSRAEISALKEKSRALIDSMDEFKSERQNYIPVSVHSASVNECKKWYEELKLQYEQEKTKLKENFNNQNKLINELNEKNSAVCRVKEELENKVKHLERQIKKMETRYLELEQTLNEVQLSKTACRKQLHKAMNFAKDLVTEHETLLKVLSEKQQENKAVKKIGCDIATRMDSLKSHLKDVQRDAFQELTIVEKRIQEQSVIIETMKQEHEEEIERLKDIIKEKDVLKGADNSLPMSHYLLFRDKYK